MRRIIAIILLSLATIALIASGYFLYIFWQERSVFSTFADVFADVHRMRMIYTLGPSVFAFLLGVWTYRASAFGTWARIVWVLSLLQILGVVGIVLSVTQPLK